jgi:hypothetical protein
MIPLLLWTLATVDSAFIGYREAAGRSALIDKRAYYRRAMLRGALFGQIAVGIVLAVAVVMLWYSQRPFVLFHDLERAGARMLLVCIPYALIILIAFIVRAARSVDLRSITSVLIFGPFTLLRPLIVIGGAVWGFLATRSPAILVLITLVVFLMLSLEWLIGRLRTVGFIS